MLFDIRKSYSATDVFYAHYFLFVRSFFAFFTFSTLTILRKPLSSTSFFLYRLRCLTILRKPLTSTFFLSCCLFLLSYCLFKSWVLLFPKRSVLKDFFFSSAINALYCKKESLYTVRGRSMVEWLDGSGNIRPWIDPVTPPLLLTKTG